MKKKKRSEWQKLGFRSYTNFLSFRKKKQKRNQDQQGARSLLSALESRDERHAQEAESVLAEFEADFGITRVWRKRRDTALVEYPLRSGLIHALFELITAQKSTKRPLPHSIGALHGWSQRPQPSTATDLWAIRSAHLEPTDEMLEKKTNKKLIVVSH